MQTHNPFGFLRYWCEYLDTLGNILVQGSGQGSQPVGSSSFSKNFGFVPRQGG